VPISKNERSASSTEPTATEVMVGLASSMLPRAEAGPSSAKACVACVPLSTHVAIKQLRTLSSRVVNIVVLRAVTPPR
jgi:hypothetical protein